MAELGQVQKKSQVQESLRRLEGIVEQLEQRQGELATRLHSVMRNEPTCGGVAEKDHRESRVELSEQIEAARKRVRKVVQGIEDILGLLEL